MSRFSRRKDANHAEVVAAFEAAGASVEAIESGRAGCPDLIVGIFGIDQLVEVKDGSKAPSKRALSKDQRNWHRAWRGRPVLVVESVEDALAVVAKMRGEMTRNEVAA